MNPNDPKFTAHALGEFDDLTPAERAEIEALLAADPSALAEAEEVRALGARLRAELSGEEAGNLQDGQRAAVFEAASEAKRPKKVVAFRRRRVVWVLAVAASVMAAVSTVLLLPALQSENARKAQALAGTWAPEVKVPALGPVTEAVPAPASEASQALSTNSPAATPPPLVAQAADPRAIQAEAELLREVEQERLRQAELNQTMAMRPVAALNQAPIPAVRPPVPAAALSLAPTTPSAAQLQAEIESQRSQFQAAGGQAVSKLRAETISAPAASRPEMPAMPFVAATRTVARRNEYSSSQVNPSRAPDDGSQEVFTGDVLVPDPRTVIDPERDSAVSFDVLTENVFARVAQFPLSTFSIDVDTASYAMVRRFLNQNQSPPKGAVRIEELINYFTYDYPAPKGEEPFSAALEVAACPWMPEHRLVRIGLKGREIAKDQRPASNLVFLIDVSGSMRPENKLPLLKRSLGMLVDQLGEDDQVAIVVYAGTSGCVLEATSDKRKMRAALNRLEAGGSTNGGSGVQLAYRLAEKSFIKGGTNRVILATDGDWNVGITDRGDLLDLIKRKAQGGVFLTVLGLGMDNLKDSMLVKLADSGNGNYAYLDTLNEARKVLVEQLSGTLVTIAKDVKIQVEFNPAEVASYRLVGYEKRMLKKEDFSNDKKDAGEIGAGHSVTALYEVIPVGLKAAEAKRAEETLKYQPAPGVGAAPLPERKGGPGDIFVEAYLSVQAGEQAEKRGDLDLAMVKYTAAETTLKQLAAQWPDWQTQIVEYRLRRTMDAITRLKQRVSAEPAADRKLEKPSAPASVPDAPKFPEPAKASKEMLTVKIRYKEPEGQTSKLVEFPLTDHGARWEQSSTDFRFAAAVASYGMLLRDSAYKGEANWSAVAEWAQEGKGDDESGYRAEFVRLVEKARAVCK